MKIGFTKKTTVTVNLEAGNYIPYTDIIALEIKEGRYGMCLCLTDYECYTWLVGIDVIDSVEFNTFRIVL